MEDVQTNEKTSTQKLFHLQIFQSSYIPWENKQLCFCAGLIYYEVPQYARWKSSSIWFREKSIFCNSGRRFPLKTTAKFLPNHEIFINTLRRFRNYHWNLISFLLYKLEFIFCRVDEQVKENIIFLRNLKGKIEQRILLNNFTE